MRKEIEELAAQLNSMYFTENPVNLKDEDYGYKYFLCFHNTHTVAVRTKTMNEMIEELVNIIDNGFQLGDWEFH